MVCFTEDLALAVGTYHTAYKRKYKHCYQNYKSCHCQLIAEESFRNKHSRGKDFYTLLIIQCLGGTDMIVFFLC